MSGHQQDPGPNQYTVPSDTDVVLIGSGGGSSSSGGGGGGGSGSPMQSMPLPQNMIQELQRQQQRLYRWQQVLQQQQQFQQKQQKQLEDWEKLLMQQQQQQEDRHKLLIQQQKQHEEREALALREFEQQQQRYRQHQQQVQQHKQQLQELRQQQNQIQQLQQQLQQQRHELQQRELQLKRAQLKMQLEQQQQQLQHAQQSQQSQQRQQQHEHKSPPRSVDLITRSRFAQLSLESKRKFISQNLNILDYQLSFLRELDPVVCNEQIQEWNKHLRRPGHTHTSAWKKPADDEDFQHWYARAAHSEAANMSNVSVGEKQVAGLLTRDPTQLRTMAQKEQERQQALFGQQPIPQQQNSLQLQQPQQPQQSGARIDDAGVWQGPNRPEETHAARRLPVYPPPSSFQSPQLQQQTLPLPQQQQQQQPQNFLAFPVQNILVPSQPEQQRQIDQQQQQLSRVQSTADFLAIQSQPLSPPSLSGGPQSAQPEQLHVLAPEQEKQLVQPQQDPQQLQEQQKRVEDVSNNPPLPSPLPAPQPLAQPQAIQKSASVGSTSSAALPVSVPPPAATDSTPARASSAPAPALPPSSAVPAEIPEQSPSSQPQIAAQPQKIPLPNIPLGLDHYPTLMNKTNIASEVLRVLGLSPDKKPLNYDLLPLQKTNPFFLDRNADLKFLFEKNVDFWDKLDPPGEKVADKAAPEAREKAAEKEAPKAAEREAPKAEDNAAPFIINLDSDSDDDKNDREASENALVPTAAAAAPSLPPQPTLPVDNAEKRSSPPSLPVKDTEKRPPQPSFPVENVVKRPTQPSLPRPPANNANQRPPYFPLAAKSTERRPPVPVKNAERRAHLGQLRNAVLKRPPFDNRFGDTRDFIIKFESESESEDDDQPPSQPPPSGKPSSGTSATAIVQPTQSTQPAALAKLPVSMSRQAEQAAAVSTPAKVTSAPPRPLPSTPSSPEPSTRTSDVSAQPRAPAGPPSETTQKAQEPATKANTTVAPSDSGSLRVEAPRPQPPTSVSQPKPDARAPATPLRGVHNASATPSDAQHVQRQPILPYGKPASQIAPPPPPPHPTPNTTPSSKPGENENNRSSNPNALDHLSDEALLAALNNAIKVGGSVRSPSVNGTPSRSTNHPGHSSSPSTTSAQQRTAASSAKEQADGKSQSQQTTSKSETPRLPPASQKSPAGPAPARNAPEKSGSSQLSSSKAQAAKAQEPPRPAAPMNPANSIPPPPPGPPPPPASNVDTPPPIPGLLKRKTSHVKSSAPKRVRILEPTPSISSASPVGNDHRSDAVHRPIPSLISSTPVPPSVAFSPSICTEGKPADAAVKEAKTAEPAAVPPGRPDEKVSSATRRLKSLSIESPLRPTGMRPSVHPTPRTAAVPKRSYSGEHYEVSDGDGLIELGRKRPKVTPLGNLRNPSSSVPTLSPGIKDPDRSRSFECKWPGCGAREVTASDVHTGARWRRMVKGSPVLLHSAGTFLRHFIQMHTKPESADAPVECLWPGCKSDDSGGNPQHEERNKFDNNMDLISHVRSVHLRQMVGDNGGSRGPDIESAVAHSRKRMKAIEDSLITPLAYPALDESVFDALAQRQQAQQFEPEEELRYVDNANVLKSNKLLWKEYVSMAHIGAGWDSEVEDDVVV